MKLRRTKIMATLGPASDDREILREMLCSGMNMVRLNFSHGSHEEHQYRLDLVRSLSHEMGLHIGILMDLQGPKIRIECFVSGSIELKTGDYFIIDHTHPKDEGNAHIVGVSYTQLPHEVNPGDHLLLDDGRIDLQVSQIEGSAVHARVMLGGLLSNRKGLNRLGGGLNAQALTDKDQQDIIFAAHNNVDFLAVSFPASGEDIAKARWLLRQAGSSAAIVAKIERAEALGNIEAILTESDAVMVARGDLGVEIGDAQLPAAQLNIIRSARRRMRPVITATQMMESMTYNPIPTRAEVFDVANAVLDGTDMVMLSGETATGRYPERTIQAMDRVCRAAETHYIDRSADQVPTQKGRIDEAIASASIHTANYLNVQAVLALTESGDTTLWMSRLLTNIPIYAFTSHTHTAQRINLYRNVYAVIYDSSHGDNFRVNREIVEILIQRKSIKVDDIIIITKGDLAGVKGGTNTMKIVHARDCLAQAVSTQD